MKLYKTEDWYHELGDCLFLHFYNFEEPPSVYFGNPDETDFAERFLTHFIVLDMNSIFDQAKLFMCPQVNHGD